VKEFPPLPDVADAPGVLEGHLWLQELVDGGPLRFRVDDRGLEFADDDRLFDRWDEPLPYARSVRLVRESFDAAGLRAQVEEPSEYVFFGVATFARSIDYDWDRLPPFLGTDVHSPDDGFLPPDRVARAFDRLGLVPVNALAKEVPARDFDPASYDVPASAWYDGPAAGVVVRNKRGGRARIERDRSGEAAVDPDDADAATLVDRFVTDGRIDAAADALADEDRQPTVDAVLERVVETVAREQQPRLAGVGGIDERAFRAAVAERVQRRLDSSN
jgi:hypothetical protein